MLREWWIGLAACTALTACAPDPSNYYGNLQPAYDGYAQSGYAQPGYVPPAYAGPGYLPPDAGPGYVPPYGYPVPVPVAPGFGYGGDRYGYDRGHDFRDREFHREFQDRGEGERRFRNDQGPINRGRFEGNRFERPRPPEPRQPPPPLPGQAAPGSTSLFPGVPRPLPR